MGVLFQNLSGFNTLVLLVIYRVVSGTLQIPRDLIWAIFNQVRLIATGFQEVITSNGFQGLLQLPFRIISGFNQLNIRIILGASEIPLRIAAIPRHVVTGVFTTVGPVVRGIFHGLLTNPFSFFLEWNPVSIIARINAMNIRFAVGALSIPIRITRSVLTLPLTIVGGILGRIPGINIIARNIPILGGSVHIGGASGSN